MARREDPRTDDELVNDFLEGDTKAFRIIVERHRTRLLHVARKYGRNDHDAEDILQEAWLKASTSMDTFRAEAKLSTWLHRVVANKGYDHTVHRHRKEDVTLDSSESPEYGKKQLVERPFDSVDTRLAVNSALMLLPPAQRAALIYVDMLGMTVTDTADELGTKPGTIKSRRARAKETLKTYENILPKA